jgi:tetratricopeptide (TPR) repeat protein
MTRIRIESKHGFVAGCLALSLCTAVITPAGNARAEQTEERALARGHFSRGLELAQTGSYEAALAEFKLAYQLSPHFSVLYNIGQAELALERPALAVETLRRYLVEGGEQIEPARRAEVTSTIATELERLGPRDDADDEERAAREPAARSEEAQPVQVPVAAPSASLSARAPVGSAPVKPSDESAGEGKRTLSYVLGAAGVVLASAALAHYAWNQSRFEDWEEAYSAYHEDPRPARRSAANELAESVDRASRVSVVLAIGAGITLGSGAVLFFSSGRSTAAPAHAGSDESWIVVRGAF